MKKQTESVRRFGIFIVAALCSISFANAAPPQPPIIMTEAVNIVEWRYIGLTTVEDTGAFEFEALRGIAAMNKACSADYGPGARAASIAEAYFRERGIDNREGWLVPGGPMVAFTASATTFGVNDAATGVSTGEFHQFGANHTMSLAYCVRYTSRSTSNRGPTVTESGTNGRPLCNITLPVACSAPVAIPIRVAP